MASAFIRDALDACRSQLGEADFVDWPRWVRDEQWLRLEPTERWDGGGDDIRRAILGLPSTQALLSALEVDEQTRGQIGHVVGTRHLMLIRQPQMWLTSMLAPHHRRVSGYLDGGDRPGKRLTGGDACSGLVQTTDRSAPEQLSNAAGRFGGDFLRAWLSAILLRDSCPTRLLVGCARTRSQALGIAYLALRQMLTPVARGTSRFPERSGTTEASPVCWEDYRRARSKVYRKRQVIERGVYMMTATPKRQVTAPMMSKRSCWTPSKMILQVTNHAGSDEGEASFPADSLPHHR